MKSNVSKPLPFLSHLWNSREALAKTLLKSQGSTKNFWVLRQTTSLAFSRCYVKGLALSPSKQYLINWIIPNASMGKFACRPFVRISRKVNLQAYWVVLQASGSSLRIHSNTPSPLKKAITQLPKDKWSFNSFFTSKKSE